jgi:genome maintenance exonuclease 1
MITNRYNYAQLSRNTEEGKRLYLLPDGSKAPSVTTILDATKSEESRQALNEWRKRVGVVKAQEISTEASGRGTRMHKFLEDWVTTGVLNPAGSNPYSIQSHRMAQAIITEGLSQCDEFYGTEVALYFPKLYAGTTDLVGSHQSKLSILDFKQTNRPKKREWIEDYFTQLAAYMIAHDEVHDTKIDRGVILMCSSEFVYQEFILEGSELQAAKDRWWRKLEQFYLM